MARLCELACVGALAAVAVGLGGCGTSTATSGGASATGGVSAVVTQGDAATRVCAQAQADSGLAGTGGSGGSGAQGQGAAVGGASSSSGGVPAPGGASTGSGGSGSAGSGSAGGGSSSSANLPPGAGTDQSALVSLCAQTLRSDPARNPDATGSTTGAAMLACEIVRGDVPPVAGAALSTPSPSAAADPGASRCAGTVIAALQRGGGGTSSASSSGG